MAPRPLEIFQKISPSVSPLTRAEVQSAGLGGGSAAAAGPLPLPSGPWHVTQLVSASFLPSARIFGSVFWPASGFFRFFASGGAFHSPWAATIPTPAAAPSATSATAAV